MIDLRDLVLFAVYFSALLPASIMRPWVGVLVYNWFGLMFPHKQTWGPAFNFPFAQWTALAVLVGLLFTRDRKNFTWTRETILVALMFVHFTITSALAWYPDVAWDYWGRVGKVLLMTAVIPIVIYGHQRIRWMIMVAALSIGFYGVKGAIWAVQSGAVGTLVGPRGSTFISPNTFLGLALVMVIPLLYYLGRTEVHKWARRGYYTAMGMTIFATPFTYSRGAMLGLAAILPLMFMRSRAKIAIILLAIPLAYFGKDLVPDRLKNRAETIENYQEDGSANLRFQSWGVNWNIAKENPLFGAGFGLEYGDDERWLSYANFLVANGDRTVNYARAAHSNYFQIVGSHGFVGLGIYLAIIVLTLLRLQSLKVRMQKDEKLSWISEYAAAIQLAIVAYAVAGAFLNGGYFDLFYLYVILTAVLWREYREATKPAAVLAPMAGQIPRPPVREAAGTTARTAP